MVDVTLPQTYSPINETLVELDRLLQAERKRRSDGLRDLASAVARLDGSLDPDLEDTHGPGDAARTGRVIGRASSRPDPAPFVPLPRRTTHGGDYGPKVRAKLTEEALRKRGWW